MTAVRLDVKLKMISQTMPIPWKVREVARESQISRTAFFSLAGFCIELRGLTFSAIQALVCVQLRVVGVFLVVLLLLATLKMQIDIGSKMLRLAPHNIRKSKLSKDISFCILVLFCSRVILEWKVVTCNLANGINSNGKSTHTYIVKKVACVNFCILSRFKSAALQSVYVHLNSIFTPVVKKS